MSRSIFGVPTVLTGSELTELIADLSEVWELTYGAPPGDIENDLRECRKFFDPLVRGYTLRDRLAQLPRTPQRLGARLRRIGGPLITDAGDQRLLVGVEGRLLFEALKVNEVTDDHTVIRSDDVSRIHSKALEIYREWCTGRLVQVVQLRTGAGKEVLQATSVGLVIAILVNRSTAPERAIVDRGDSREGALTNSAVHLGAIRFAERITSGRKKSPGEQKLRGGYIISEARRRLAHRLVVTEGASTTESLVYIPEEFVCEVIEFLGSDLSRRPNLSGSTLRSGLDDLIVAYRSVASDLASQSLVHERPADTSQLVEMIMSSFGKHQKDRSE